jgi:hypothetical protein
MKTKIFIPQIAALLASVALAFGQPTNLPQINPYTGMPASEPAEISPTSAVMDTLPLEGKVKSLIFQGRYDEALQQYLAYHDKYRAGSAWDVILPQWTELARRYPKAKTALFQIRNHDLVEFSEGRGYKDLFSEVKVVSHALHQDDATCDLFTSFRDTDADLAQQCYGMVEDLLLAKGDYQWCYRHIGDPQDNFDSIRQVYVFNLDCQKRLAESRERMIQMTRMMEQKARQQGRTNSTVKPPPDTLPRIKKLGEENFVNETRNLIEILVGVNHKDDAEKIRDQALAVLGDPRLQSAVTDAEEKIHNQPGQTGRGKN